MGGGVRGLGGGVRLGCDVDGGTAKIDVFIDLLEPFLFSVEFANKERSASTINQSIPDWTDSIYRALKATLVTPANIDKIL